MALKIKSSLELWGYFIFSLDLWSRFRSYAFSLYNQYLYIYIYKWKWPLMLSYYPILIYLTLQWSTESLRQMVNASSEPEHKVIALHLMRIRWVNVLRLKNTTALHLLSKSTTASQLFCVCVCVCMYWGWCLAVLNIDLGKLVKFHIKSYLMH